MVATKASDEKGRTTPEVPIMEIPPTIPNFGLKVLRASSSPSGTEISMTTPCFGIRWASRIFSVSAAIIFRGVGFIAGSPISKPNPGKVTIPTPFPAAKRIPVSLESITFAQISRLLVTSGSSPASLTTVQIILCPSFSVRLTGNSTSSPSGRVIVTWFNTSPVSRVDKAAFAAAQAQLPVVKPLCNG